LEAFAAKIISSRAVAEREARDASGNWHLVRGRPYWALDNKIDGAVILAMDIDALKRVERDLRQAKALLESRVEERTSELSSANRALRAEIEERQRLDEIRQNLLRQLLTAQEDERARLSRELHDNIGQYLSGMKLALSSLASVCQSGSHKTVFNDLLSNMTTVTRELRNLVFDLRPASLDDLGICQSLKTYAETWAQRANARIVFTCESMQAGRLTSAIEITIYRIVQELLHNVFKHAQAAEVQVLLEGHADFIIAKVSDNGIGFDEAAANAKGGVHFGLMGTRERLRLVCGSLTIESSPNKGATVTARIPLPSRPEAIKSREARRTRA
jgi:signal transduction histidine kinase